MKSAVTVSGQHHEEISKIHITVVIEIFRARGALPPRSQQAEDVIEINGSVAIQVFGTRGFA